jgi:hypothetical protein
VEVSRYKREVLRRGEGTISNAECFM